MLQRFITHFFTKTMSVYKVDDYQRSYFSENITGLPTVPTQQESDDQNLVLAAKCK